MRKLRSYNWITCAELKACTQPVGECWEWQHSTQRGGYGMFRRHNKAWAAHRVSYFMHSVNAPLEVLLNPKVFICHKCDNPKCINPVHLFIGNNKINSEDKARKMRQHYGERSPQAYFTEQDVRHVFKLASEGWSQSQIGKKFGVRQNYISSILLRKVWKHTLINKEHLYDKRNIRKPHSSGLHRGSRPSRTRNLQSPDYRR